MQIVKRQSSSCLDLRQVEEKLAEISDEIRNEIARQSARA